MRPNSVFSRRSIRSDLATSALLTSKNVQPYQEQAQPVSHWTAEMFQPEQEVGHGPKHSAVPEGSAYVGILRSLWFASTLRRGDSALALARRLRARDAKATGTVSSVDMSDCTSSVTDVGINSVRSGTIHESSKMALPKWFLAMHLMRQAKNNVSALELKRHLGVSYPTAWLIKHKLMEVMFLRDTDRKLTGRIEADDARC